MARTLLLADDSVTIQRVVELTFADEDIAVVAVSDGDQAIACIEANPPDIVLADIGMPGRTGYEVAQYVKQSRRLSHIPVVLLTGAFEPVDEARAAAAGCDGVLAKPFAPQLVIARVKDLLARAGRDAQATGDPSATEGPRSPDAARLDSYLEELDAALGALPPAAALSAAAVPDLPADVPQPPAAAPIASSSPGVSTVSSPLADAFAALLAAEQQPAQRPLPTTWAARPAVAVNNQMIEEITRRVLDRLSTSVVRSQVTEVVSTVAERLVREEIERIKSSIT